MKVAQTTTSSTDALPRRTSGASGHKATLGPRPAFPAAPLTARPLARELAAQGWDSIPSAPYGPVSMTRAQVTTALRAAEQDEPAERMYDRIVLGRPHAWGAF